MNLPIPFASSAAVPDAVEEEDAALFEVFEVAAVSLSEGAPAPPLHAQIKTIMQGKLGFFKTLNTFL